jgi:hypothetical protein
VKLFFFLPFAVSDEKLFSMSPDIDTYIYLLFLRMSLAFFALLAAINILVTIPIYSTGIAQI